MPVLAPVLPICSLATPETDRKLTNLSFCSFFYSLKCSNRPDGSQVLKVESPAQVPPSSPSVRPLSHLAASTIESSDSHKARNVQNPAVTVRFPFQAGTTNATMALGICDNSYTGVITIFEVFRHSSVQDDSLHILLPDCFYATAYAPTLSEISLYGMIIRGNLTFPDPMDRLMKSINAGATTTISFNNSILVPYSASESTEYAPDWINIFNNFPLLIRLALKSSRIIGSLPSSIPSTLRYFDVSYNPISGLIPPTFFANVVSASSYSFSAFSTNLSGTIPPSLLAPFLNVQSSQIYIFLGNNPGISGALPSTLLNVSASTVTITLDLSESSITGNLPNDLWGLPITMLRLGMLYLNFSSTGLTGTIPTSWINQYHFQDLNTLDIRMKDCLVSGSLNRALIPRAVSGMKNYVLTLTNNPLQASIDPSLFNAVLDQSIYSSISSLWTFNLQNASITGALALSTPPPSSTNLPLIALNASSNSISSFSASVNASKAIKYLDLSYNRAMIGSVDNLFSPFSAPMTILDVRSTLLSGIMPSMTLVDTSSLQQLYMDGISTDFCSGSNRTSAWGPALTNCSLLSTSASNCASQYPSICAISVLPPSTPSPVGCPGTPPTPEFVCVNGVWTFTGTITAPTIVITPGTSEVIVIGNVTSGTVVLQGTGSSITVTGCFTNLSVVTIQLTPEDLKKLGSHSVIELLRSDGNCSDYSTVAVGTAVSGSSCRTVKVDKATTSSGSLNGVFSVSSSGCNLWWIILVSVLAALVLIGAIVLLVVLHLRKKHSISSAKSHLNG